MEEEHILYEMDIPKELKTKLEKSLWIQEYAKNARITRYRREVNLKYAAALSQLAWCEFNMNGLETEYEDLMSYSHRIDADMEKNKLYFIREGNKDPSIYDKILLSINPK